VPKVGQKLDELHDGKKAVLELKKKEPKALKENKTKHILKECEIFRMIFTIKSPKILDLLKLVQRVAA
jgi:hypothetical protein